MNNDNFFFGNEAIYPIDPGLSKINSNVAVVGGTGCGKTKSIATPLLLHNKNHSMVVPASKRQLLECKPILEKHGYNVEVIDLTMDGSLSTVGFDPIASFTDSSDCIDLALKLVSAVTCNSDKFWENSAADLISALLYLAVLNADVFDENPRWEDFRNLFRMVRVADSDPYASDPLDLLFSAAEDEHPGNYATATWRSMSRRSEKTFSCIYSAANASVGRMFSDNIMKAASLPLFDFASLGRTKTVLFILTSAADTEITAYVNLMYSVMLNALMNEAERSDSGRLDIPVQIIFDDFACGTKIEGFDSYISIFRSAGISAVLLLQSESQLSALYGQYSATTILNNCDSYVYMGGNDYYTCEQIGRRIDRPASRILQLDLDSVIIMRRGSTPVITERYRIFDDPLYRKCFSERER